MRGTQTLILVFVSEAAIVAIGMGWDLMAPSGPDLGPWLMFLGVIMAFACAWVFYVEMRWNAERTSSSQKTTNYAARLERLEWAHEHAQKYSLWSTRIFKHLFENSPYEDFGPIQGQAEFHRVCAVYGIDLKDDANKIVELAGKYSVEFVSRRQDYINSFERNKPYDLVQNMKTVLEIYNELNLNIKKLQNKIEIQMRDLVK